MDNVEKHNICINIHSPFYHSSLQILDINRVVKPPLKESEYLKHLDVDGRIILKWILMKEMGGCGGGFIWLRIGTTDEFL
jgi:hypothetical protein